MNGNRKSREGELEEGGVLYFRADMSGAIQFVSSLAPVVSGYDGGDLIGAKQVDFLHSDIPKSVPYAVGREVAAGRPAAAYLKGKTRSGIGVWALVLTISTSDGYISVMTSPAAGRLENVEKFYRAVRDREAKGWSARANGGAFLDEQLKEAGFPSYRAFSSKNTAEEVAKRRDLLGEEPDATCTQMLEISPLVSSLKASSQALSNLFLRMRTTPVNMGIMASRIEQTGGPISAISSLYSSMSVELGTWIKSFAAKSADLFDRLEGEAEKYVVGKCFTELLREFEASFTEGDLKSSSVEASAEAELVAEEILKKAEAADRALAAIRRDARELNSAVKVLKRHVMGLSSTRVMCEIESAKLEQRSMSFAGVVKQLGAFQIEIERVHEEMEASILKVVNILTDDESRVAGEGSKAGIGTDVIEDVELANNVDEPASRARATSEKGRTMEAPANQAVDEGEVADDDAAVA